MEIVRPYVFPDPVAPLVAARRMRARIDIETIHRNFDTLASDSDVVLVEGAGGLLVPYTESHSCATLFRELDLDVIVVAANKLGVVNHARLTVECAQAHGLRIRAVVLNTISNDRSDPSQRTNEALLKELLVSIPVVKFPQTSTPRDFLQLAALARDLSTSTLRRS